MSGLGATHDHLSQRHRVGIGVVLLAWGMQAIVTQSVLLREALVLMHGSELAWGIVLFAWLLGVAIGGTLAGWGADRLRRPDVVAILLLICLGIGSGLSLWLFRGARGMMGLGPGELLPLPETAAAALLFVTPVSTCVGAVFPLACCAGRAADRTADAGAGPLGRVYALESAGSLIGGAAFTFWVVEHLSPVQVVLLCTAVTMAASVVFAWTARHKPIAATSLIIAAVAILLTVTATDEKLDRYLVQRRWAGIAPKYELVAAAESRYQNLMIGCRAGQYTLYCDGQLAASFPDPYAFVPMAHFWMCQHPSPRRVLMLGGGAEGLLAEILRHPIERVDYVEMDPRLTGLIEPLLAPTDRAALADARVCVHHMDARHFIKMQDGTFDLVIARLPEPTSALRARLYTDEFHGELRRAMTSKAVLCMTASATPNNLTRAQAEYLASIRATLRRHFHEVIIGWGNPAHILATTASGLASIDPAELTRRYEQRSVQSELFHPLWFEGAVDWLDARKLKHRSDELDAVREPEISTDLRPVIYMQRLTLWEQMIHHTGGDGGAIVSLRSVRLPTVALVLVLIVAIVLAAYRIKARDRTGWGTGAVVSSIGTTGFATMALSIIWLYAFQSLYGYVYQRIGWIIALFMVGLVVGCMAADYTIGRKNPVSFAGQQHRPGEDLRERASFWRGLVAVDLLLALLAAAVPVVLPAVGTLQASSSVFILVEVVVSAMVALTGVLGGLAFALAGGLRLGMTGETGAAAGSIVGADHAGACAGAILTGVLLVPVFGTTTAALVLAGMKLGSALVLAVAGTKGCER